MSPVVINEFEMVAASAAEREVTQGNAAEARDAAPTQPKSPVQEVERVLRWKTERKLRVWAH